MTTPPSSSPATQFAAALLDALIASGVRDVVVSPGSRSQAIALAAAKREASGDIRLRVRIDERVAGFLALGLAVESRSPVVIITTSGTAVANLHPAVLEAHHSGVPLIVLTADRPQALRGIGVNQTTVQPGIFANAIRRSWDVAPPTGAPDDAARAVSLAREVIDAATDGPVHVNLAFDMPLSARETELEPIEVGTAAVAADRDIHLLQPQPHTVVVAGTGAGEHAEAVARALGAPLFAEVASGAHFGPNLVVSYRALLNEPEFGGLIERVIVFGHPTLSREVPALIKRDGVATTVVRSASFDDYNPGRRVSSFVDAVEVEGPLEPDARAWVGRWVAASRALLETHDAPPTEIAVSSELADMAAFNRAVLAGLRAPVSRRSLVEAVWRMTWPHDRLVVGASRLIRELDIVAPGKKIRVHANRGLAGIDGTIATATGIALASQNADGVDAATGVTRVLLGDLALLHDVGALLYGAGEPKPRIQVIVGNDGGGTIFDNLEVARSATPGEFDRVMLTRQEVSLEQLAAAYGWEYRRVENRGQLDEALTPGAGPTLIEVPLAR